MPGEQTGLAGVSHDFYAILDRIRSAVVDRNRAASLLSSHVGVATGLIPAATAEPASGMGSETL